MNNRPLTIQIEEDELVIRVGVDTLALAASHSPYFFNPDEPYLEEYMGIDNPYILMEDVIRELNKEKEDGTTPVHLLLDDAIYSAYEDGSLAFKE